MKIKINKSINNMIDVNVLLWWWFH